MILPFSLMHSAILAGMLVIKLKLILRGTDFATEWTAALYSRKVLQPIASSFLSIHAHKFSAGLRSGLLGGHGSRMLTLEACLAFHSFTNLMASLCNWSLSCWSTHKEMPWAGKIRPPHAGELR